MLKSVTLLKQRVRFYLSDGLLENSMRIRIIVAFISDRMKNLSNITCQTNIWERKELSKRCMRRPICGRQAWKNIGRDGRI